MVLKRRKAEGPEVNSDNATTKKRKRRETLTDPSSYRRVVPYVSMEMNSQILIRIIYVSILRVYSATGQMDEDFP
jgi:predicted NUDIX family phosphoesterase